MNIQLICQKSQFHMLSNILLNYGYHIVNESSVLVIDNSLLDGLKNISSYDLVIQYNPNHTESLIQLLQNSATYTINKHLTGKEDDRYVPVQLEEIILIYANGNETYIVNKDLQTLRIRFKLYQLEEGLLPHYFIRINRSEMINIRCIESISPMFKGNLLLHMKNYTTTLDVTRNYLKDFKERLGIL